MHEIYECRRDVNTYQFSQILDQNRYSLVQNIHTSMQNSTNCIFSTDKVSCFNICKRWKWIINLERIYPPHEISMVIHVHKSKQTHLQMQHPIQTKTISEPQNNTLDQNAQVVFRLQWQGISENDLYHIE